MERAVITQATRAETKAGFPWLAVASLVIALGLLAGGIVLTQTQLRSELRNQLAHRDARSLAAILQKQLSPPGEFGAPDPLPALLEALLLPELPGVWDVQLYDATGLPTINILRDPRAQSPTPEQFAAVNDALADFESRDNPLLPLAAKYHPVGGGQLNVVVPLIGGASQGESSTNVALVAFTLDGSSLASEFVQLDRTLQRRNWVVFGFLGIGLVGALGFAFFRLLRTQRLLQLRSSSLEAANRELTLAAKSSAVGAVAAHLVHELKNPLAGLQRFVDGGERAGGELDRVDAVATARRMKMMIDEVMRVVRDEQGLTSFEISVAELLAHVHQRTSAEAMARGIQLQCSSELKLSLSNRSASLTVLILENLLTNALQVLPAGGIISITATAENGGLNFRVRDNGPGLPASMSARIFQPGATTKSGGTGLGLALSQQLARAIEGELALAESTDRGTEFKLTIPVGNLVS